MKPNTTATATKYSFELSAVSNFIAKKIKAATVKVGGMNMVDIIRANRCKVNYSK